MSEAGDHREDGQAILRRIDANLQGWLYANVGPGSVVLDIGAECGSWAVPAAALGATVYAFEPEPVAAKVAALAVVNKFADRLHVVQRAVGAAAPDVRIDDFVRGLGLSRVDVIKIDVEGHELLVLDGAADTIRRYHPTMLVEVHYDGGHGGTPITVDDVARRVTAAAPGSLFLVTDYAHYGWRGAHVGVVPPAHPAPADALAGDPADLEGAELVEQVVGEPRV